MKTFIRTLGLATAFAFVLCAGQARAQDDSAQAGATTQGDSGVSFQTFYDQLASQGSWINTDQYGYVFQPTENDPNWRPYTYGHWVNTDAGMTWVSDDSFGWATDHYGRWANIDGYGWVWVPGYTWAPAWVSWRTSDEDVGWAPLPPDSDEGIDYYDDDDYFTDADFGFGFHIGDDCDLAYGIGPWYYNFCPIAFIGDRDCWRHFHDRRDNFALIGHTRNVTNINYRRDGAGRFGHVHAEGPSVAALNAHARTHIETAQLASASRVGDAGLHGNRLAVFAPRVDPTTAKTARPNSVSRTLANTNVNRGTDINRPLAVNSAVRPAGPTAEQIHAANVAQGNASSSARVATAGTHASRPLTQPLTSLRTNTRANSEFGAYTRFNTAQTSHIGAPSASGESRFTPGIVTPHATMSSSGESRYTGEAVTPRASTPFREDSRFTDEPARSQVIAPTRTSPAFHSFPASEEFPSPSSFQSSAPVFHQSAPMFHPQSSTPFFHQSAPVFHSQPSFYSPAPHFGGGAPAAHFSGGGFGGGGHPSGGGSVHASGGGGHAGGGGHR